MSRLLRIAYQLRYHSFAGWALDRWLATLLVVAALLVWLAGRQRTEWPDWSLAGLLLLAGAAVLALRRWAAGRMYVVFLPDAGSPVPGGQALDPAQKIALRASGEFEVEGKQRFFADLFAYWRTFATREHAVMAIRPRSRYLLLGRAAAEDLGMWYIFIQPPMLTAVSAGELAWGGRCRPALEVRYRLPSAGRQAAWRRLLGRPAPDGERRLLYLAFNDQPARLRVWADLLAD